MKTTSKFWTRVLKLNTRLMHKAIKRNDFKRIMELSLHRSCVKDCINEELTKEIK